MNPGYVTSFKNAAEHTERHAGKDKKILTFNGVIIKETPADTACMSVLRIFNLLREGDKHF